MNTMKKVLATGMAAITLLSSSAAVVPANAAHKLNYNCSKSYNHYTRMKITNRKKAGYATFYIGCTSTNTKVKVKLTNYTGKWLWESNLGFRCGYYRFELGNNNSGYRFYFKKISGSGGVAIRFAAGGNISIGG